MKAHINFGNAKKALKNNIFRGFAAFLIVFASTFLTVSAQVKWQNDEVAAVLFPDNPATFLNFTAVKADNIVYLNWHVLNQKNNALYLIERSADGNNFEIIDYKQGYGSEVPIKLLFSYVDKAPLSSKGYYRIVQVKENPGQPVENTVNRSFTAYDIEKNDWDEKSK